MTVIRSVILLAALGLSSPAQAGWFDWFKPGEWFGSFSGLFDFEDADARGFYVGGGASVVRGSWGMQRRLSGPEDPDPLYQREPAYMTTGFLRGGWAPLSWLEIEGEWNFDIDKAEISENPRQVAELDSLSGITLRPMLPMGGVSLFAELGFHQFNINARCELDERRLNGSQFVDPQLSQSCQNFDDSGLSWGAGLSLRLSDATRLQFAWRQLFDDDFDDNGSDDRLSAVSISVTVGFGGSQDTY